MSGKLDANQVLKNVYDKDENRLRVDAEVTATIGTVSVDIDASEGDNISIKDESGANAMNVNADGSIDVSIVTPLEMEISAADGDSIIMVGTSNGAIGGSQNVPKVDSSGQQYHFKMNSLVTSAYDTIEFGYPSSSTETFVFKSSGSTVATVTITYTDATKALVSSVVRS